MSEVSSRMAPPQPLYTWGRRLLGAVLVLGLAVTLGLVALDQPLVLGLWLGALVVAPLAVFVLQRPTLNLFVVLVGVLVLSQMQPGYQLQEVLYGLYYIGYLAGWYALRLFVYRERIAVNVTDYAVGFFLVWMTLSLVSTFLHGGALTGAVSEWTALLMFAFYFPVRDLCARRADGLYILLGVVLVLGFYFTFDKIVNYQRTLLEATEVWQVVRGRAARYEMYVLVPSITTLTFYLFARRPVARLLLLIGFLLSFGALIMTQSRGYWADFGLGAVVLFFLVDWTAKKRLLVLGVVGTTAAGVLATILFGDLVPLIVSGLVDRFLSIGTAATKDISLVNRFYESAAVWARIKMSPILGYGMAVPYRVFDLTYEATLVKAFIHNGFLSLWYRFGVVGLSTVLVVWGTSIWRGYRTFREPSASPLTRVSALNAMILLVALLPSCNTSNPFVLSLNIFMFTLLVAWVNGAHMRSLMEGGRSR